METSFHFDDARIIENNEYCCGCGACVQICPVKALELKRDERGFLYPYLEEAKCIHCNKCKSVCDFQSANRCKESASALKVFGYISSSSDVLEHSTSGGAFTAISDYILGNNGIVVGAIMDKEMRIIHAIAKTPKERNKMMGSKYVQSDLGDVFCVVKECILKDRDVLFSGTPCQVAGLKMYLGQLAESKKLLTCDVICHGAMSPLVIDKFHEYLEKKTKKRITEHIFRYKKAGWEHIECLKYDDGSIDYQSVYSQLYKRLFDIGLGIRSSCFQCKYASLNRVGDITLGDFWGINDVAPEYYSPSGVSMVMINTLKGMDVFEKVKNSGQFFETDVNSVTLKQPHLKKPISRHKDDEIFWEYIIRDQFKKAVKLCGYNPEWAEVKHKIKRCLLMR